MGEAVMMILSVVVITLLIWSMKEDDNDRGY